MANERVLIQGIGGIGGVIASKMIESGQSPVLVTHNLKITETIRAKGLRTKTLDGETQVTAEVYTLLDEVPKDVPFDASYLIMKANSVVDSAILTMPLLKPDGYLVTFQNGIVEDAVSEVAGRGRVIGGIIGWGGTMHEPGVYEKTSIGSTLIGELDGSATERVQGLKQSIECAAPVVISDNIRGALWSKLALNCTVTTIGALTGGTLGEMLQNKAIRQLFLRGYSEVVDTAEALGIRLEPIAADPKLLYLSRNAGAFARFKKDLIMRILGRKYKNSRGSMLQSLERGRPTEIDFLNGYVVEQANKAGVPVPINETLVRLIKEIEAGKRSMGQQNVDDLIKAAA